jgi:PAS domain S-box-containing protein
MGVSKRRAKTSRAAGTTRSKSSGDKRGKDESWRVSRLTEQQDALVQLAKNEAIHGGMLEQAFRAVTEVAARMIGVERAGVWLFNQDRSAIELKDLFEATAGRHSAGAVLQAHRYPAYFRALGQVERAIDAHDALRDPRTKEYSESYLIPLGIGAMLDAPIRQKGIVVGVLCHEHVGGRRTWTMDEQSFAGALATMVTLALEAHERRESPRRFMLAMEATTEGAWDWNIQTGVVYYSSRWMSSLGYDPGEVPPHVGFWESIVHPDDMPRVREALREHFEGRTPVYECENRLKMKSGVWRPNLDRGKVVEWDAKGKPLRMVGTDTDITQQKEAEKEAARQARLLESFWKFAPACLVILDRDFNFVRVNDMYAKACGRAVAEFPGHNHFEFYPSDAQAIFENVRATKTPFHIRARPFVFPDHPEWGVTYWDWSLVPILDAAGEVELLVFSLNDVTDCKRVEEQLRNHELHLRSIIETSPECIKLVDRDGTVLEMNAAGLRMLEADSPDAVIGGNVYSLIVPEHRAAYRTMLESVCRGEKGFLEYEIAGFRGTRRWLETHAVPLPSRESGELLLLAITRDVTQHKRAEQLLRESLERFDLAVRGSTDGLWDVALVPDDLFNPRNPVYYSPRFKEMLGFQESEFDNVIGSWSSRLHPDDRDRVFAAVLAHVERRVPYDIEYRMFTQTGECRWFAARGQAVWDDKGRPVRMSGSFNDITDRKRAELVLTMERQVLESIANGSPLAVVLDLLVRRVEAYATETLCSILLLDRDGLHLRHGAAPSLPEALNRSIDGVAIEPAVGPCGMAARHARQVVVTDIATDSDWRVFSDIVLPYGLQACWSTPILSSSGKVLGTFAMYYRQPHAPNETDQQLITHVTHLASIAMERKQKEEELAQHREQLRQAAKMEAVGRLAGGIAHDFNNLLTVINGYSDMLLQRFKPGDALRRQAEEIKKAGERAADLTKQLLTFSRRQIVQPQPVEINAMVINLTDMLRRLLGEHVCLEVRLSPASTLIDGDPGQIEQIIVNLAVNARDAMPDGGTVTIETEIHERCQAHTLEGGVLQGPCVHLVVRDTGQGMDAETRTHIFEPFFTTKEQGRGTGLGLATVYGIVSQMGGAIRVESDVGRGTTMTVDFPALAEGRSPADAPAVVPDEKACSETILLVEDEEVVRNFSRDVLTEAGYRVLAAENGEEALRLSAGYQNTIHLLLTDVVMPGMDGRHLAERIVSTHPTTKILFMSGYTDDEILRRGVSGHQVAFLQKPFSPDALRRKVRETLDG